MGMGLSRLRPGLARSSCPRPPIVRWVPVDTDNFRVITPNPRTGQALMHKVGRGVGGSAGTDLGGSWPRLRHLGTQDLPNTTSAIAAASGTYSSDTGAQDYAFQFGTQWGCSYHGVNTGNVVQSVKVDGVTIDPTVATTGKASVRIDAVETAIWPGGQQVIIDSSIEFRADGTIVETINSVTSAASFTLFYLGMDIGTGNFTEAQVGSGGALVAVPATADRGIYGASTTAVLRNPDDGRMIKTISAAPAKTGFSRMEVDRYPAENRTKTYFRFTGVPNAAALAGLTRTTSFLHGAPGATSFGVNLVTNGGFGSDLAGWTQTAGASSWAAGKAQQTRQAGADNKLTQLIGSLDVTAQYLLSVDCDAANGNYVLGINTNGSTSGAVINQTPTPGGNAHMFQPPQAQLQAMLYQAFGAGAAVVNWDNVSLIKLAAVA